jgi:hypothetical protein
MTSHSDSTVRQADMTMPRPQWQTPRLRRLPASEAEMPVGKASPGTDGVSMS